MGTAGRKSISLFIAWVAFFWHPVAAAAYEARCSRPEPEWSSWSTDAELRNPGLQRQELAGRQRDELLRAYARLEQGEGCPPDHVWVLYCSGRAKVLLAFVKEGCVTLAEDIRIEDFQNLIGGGMTC